MVGYLIVIADYYKDISKGLLSSALSLIPKSNIIKIISVPGTQAITTRGFGLNECKKVGELITKTLKGLSENPDDNSKVEDEVRNEVIALTSSFPIYKNL